MIIRKGNVIIKSNGAVLLTDYIEYDKNTKYLKSEGNIKFLNKNSSIVNISSFSAISGGPYSSHYAISKAGIETLTKNLAIFLS